METHANATQHTRNHTHGRRFGSRTPFTRCDKAARERLLRSGSSSGAGDGNRTHDIQLGKQHIPEGLQGDMSKTPHIAAFAHQRLRPEAQNRDGPPPDPEKRSPGARDGDTGADRETAVLGGTLREYTDPQPTSTPKVYSEALASFMRTIAAASDDNRLTVFEMMCREAAGYVRNGGLDLHDYGDAFQEAADMHGLVERYGQDSITAFMAEAIEPTGAVDHYFHLTRSSSNLVSG
jgi:hypothetical protein